MAVLLFDLEATGKDPKEARIIEIGAMITNDSFDEPVVQYSQLVWESGYPALTDEVIKVTGISQEELSSGGIPLKDAFKQLAELIGPEVTHIIAYNRGYDEVLTKTEMSRNGLDFVFPSIPWVCSMMDIEESVPFKVPKKMMYLALDHGVAVNPKELHRAISDVELMRKLLKASGTTPQKMLEYQRSPWVYMRAKVQKPWEDNGKSTALAKAQGYSFEKCFGDDSGRSFEKCWVKRIKEKDLEKELTHDFKVVRLE